MDCRAALAMTRGGLATTLSGRGSRLQRLALRFHRLRAKPARETRARLSVRDRGCGAVGGRLGGAHQERGRNRYRDGRRGDGEFAPRRRGRTLMSGAGWVVLN